MKLVKEILFEKFSEDSDPITDMGIGIYAHRNFNSYEKFHKFLYNVAPFLINIDDLTQIIDPSEEYVLFPIYYDKLLNYMKKYITIGNEKMLYLEVDEFKKLILTKTKDKKIKESLNEKFTEDSDPIHDMGIGISKIIKDSIRNIYKYDFKQILLKGNNKYYYGTDPNNIRSIVIANGTFQINFYSDEFYDLNHKRILKKDYARELFKKANIDNFIGKILPPEKYSTKSNDEVYEIKFQIILEYVRFFKDGYYSKHRLDFNK
jgi:hypothetical protein